MQDRDSHSEIMRSLGGLEVGVDGINKRLDKVNGSVARHEKEIGEVKHGHSNIVEEVSKLYGDVHDSKIIKRKRINIFLERLALVVGGIVSAVAIAYFLKILNL